MKRTIRLIAAAGLALSSSTALAATSANGNSQDMLLPPADSENNVPTAPPASKARASDGRGAASAEPGQLPSSPNSQDVLLPPTDSQDNVPITAPAAKAKKPL